VALKDAGAVAGIRLPDVLKLENPLFAVVTKIFDLKSVGIKEIFLVIVAFLLDLGDIIGYSLVPNRRRNEREEPIEARPEFPGPERIPVPRDLPAASLLSAGGAIEPSAKEVSDPTDEFPAAAEAGSAAYRPVHRPFRFRR